MSQQHSTRCLPSLCASLVVNLFLCHLLVSYSQLFLATVLCSTCTGLLKCRQTCVPMKCLQAAYLLYPITILRSLPCQLDTLSLTSPFTSPLKEMTKEPKIVMERSSVSWWCLVQGWLTVTYTLMMVMAFITGHLNVRL